MRVLLSCLLIAVFTTGCASVGTKTFDTGFPEPPAKLMDEPPPLKTIRNMTLQERFDYAAFSDSSMSNIPMSVLVKKVAENYGICYQYKEQITGLQQWILEQKKVSVTAP